MTYYRHKHPLQYTSLTPISGGPSLTVSSGNRKLFDILVFNLPTILTCPWRTLFCQTFCYTLQGYNNSPSAQRCQMGNYNFSQREDFVPCMVFILQHRPEKIMRLHSSGDFYSEEYLSSWIEIARQLPDRTFYAYTRSWALFKEGTYAYQISGTTDWPSNLVLRYSVDASTKDWPDVRMPLAFTDDPATYPKTLIIPAHLKPTRKPLTCPEVQPPTAVGGRKGRRQYCNNNCRLCWRAEAAVIFPLHGNGPVGRMKKNFPDYMNRRRKLPVVR